MPISHRKSPGYAMLSVIVIGMVLVTSVAILLQAVASYDMSIQRSVDNSRALFGAQSGLVSVIDCIQPGQSPEPTPMETLNPSLGCDGSTIGLTSIASIGGWTNTFTATPSQQFDGLTTMSSAGSSTIGLNNVGDRNLKLDLITNSNEYLHFDPNSGQNWNQDPLLQAPKVSAGGSHSCTIGGNKAYCWGNGNSGQLGHGSSNSQTAPTPVSNTSQMNFTQISTGNDHTCAVADSRAYCWGNALQGKLGDGTHTARNVPTPVSNLDNMNVTQVSAGTNHTCAIANSQAYCWGSGTYGSIGDGGTTNRPTPALVSDFEGMNVTGISAADTHTCAIADGRAYCWGNGARGRLGNGSTSNRSNPTLVLDLSGTVSQISAGLEHTCAVADGQAYCWGRGSNGKLGNGSTSERHTPIPVSNLDGMNVTQISAGTNHTCAIADGWAYCWGLGSHGRLGDGSTSSRSTPTLVSDLAGILVTNISTGSEHTCAVADRQTYCWGRGSNGKIGDGTTTNRSNPTLIFTFEVSNATQISAGYRHSCAIAGDQAYCWGRGGSIGDNTSSSRALPTLVSNFDGMNVTQISAGSDHTCAIAAGGAYCWGTGSSGRLGNGSTSTRLAPTPVSDLAGMHVTQISAGGEYTCAVADGQAYCWGRGSNGKLGNGSTSNRSNPTLVSGLDGMNVTHISAGGNHTCAIADEQAYCWGSGSNGALGRGSTSSTSTPVLVSNLADVAVTDISTGTSHTCAVADSRAYCWGNALQGKLGDGTHTARNVPTPVSNLDGMNVTQISAGGDHSCVLADGEQYCWGSGLYGAVGNGSTLSQSTPSQVSTLTGVVTQMSAGLEHTCAIMEASVYCWGRGADSRLGIGTTSSQILPAKVFVSSMTSGGTPYNEVISSGDMYTCATTSSGRAYCWGNGADGRLGNGLTSNRTTPTPVSSLDGMNVTQISAGSNHACAVADGKAYCWGRGVDGVLGDGTSSQRNTPTAVIGLEGKQVSQISATNSHTCAVADGEAYCWGRGGHGRLGNGSTDDQSVPTLVSGFNGMNVTQISSGSTHSCALVNAQAYCWGQGTYGKLGVGSSTTHHTPVHVSSLNGMNVTQISSGSSHNCAIANRQAYCWGSASAGRLGNGETQGAFNTPTPVYGLDGRNVMQISMGGNYSCAVVDGGAYCWGPGNFGRLGNGSTVNQATPSPVSNINEMDVIQIGSGRGDLSSGHTCAIVDGSAYCWGFGGQGQLGNNSITSSLVPVRVAPINAGTVEVRSFVRY